MFHDTQSTNDAPLKFRSWHPLPALAGKPVHSISQYIFETIEVAQDQPTEWLWTYNNERPKMGIGGITPGKTENNRVNSTAGPH